jgi:diguanylate cyclase (GGDEF)-like protein
VLSQTLQKKPVDSIRALAAAHDVERLRLALTGAREAAFDWTIADDRIAWDGALELLSLHNDPDRLKRGEAFRAWMSDAGRAKLQAMLDEASQKDFAFELDFEAASALGSEWMELRGVRVSGADGRAERVVGMLRATTEKVREAQRLHYRATRDELTGHLNRTSLREELSHAIEAAKAEQRTCAYLVTSIDRLAAINEAYGFGAADEVIVAVGERLAGSLRGTDIIGRIAGNKLGVIVGNCSEREIALVGERLRAAVRNSVISTRGGIVSATINVGAVCLPSSAASSQEAMLRAEEALDHARGSGRAGVAGDPH